MTHYATRRRLEELLRRRASEARTEVPLSYGQHSLLLLHHRDSDSAAYHVGFAARFTGGFDAGALRGALRSLVTRHEMLRTTFRGWDVHGRQTVHGWLEPGFEQTDATGWDERELHERVHADYRRPLDVLAGPLVRAHVYDVAPGEAVVLLVLHHLVVDFHSLGVLLPELGELYAGEVRRQPVPLPAQVVGYADFVRYQQELLADERGARARAYWHEQLAGDLPVCEWPAFRVDPGEAQGGASADFALPAELAREVFDFARAENVTPYVLLLTVYQALISRNTGDDEVLVGTPVAGRTDAAFDGCVGYFVDPSVLRADFSGAPSLRDALRATRRRVAEALEYQDYPFELLVRELAPRRSADRNPVFQTMFIYQKPQRFPELASLYMGVPYATPVSWGGLTLRPFRLAQQEDQLDLILEIVQDAERLLGVVKYRRSVFSRGAAERAVAHFERLLRAGMAEPDRPMGELPLVTEAELAHPRKTAPVRIDASDSLVRRFERTAARRAGHPAVRCAGRGLTYAELDGLADVWAARLRAEGVGPGDRVAVLVEPGTDLVVAILAVLKAGAAYVSLDHRHPTARWGTLLADCGAGVALTQSRFATTIRALGSRPLCMDDADPPGAPSATAPVATRPVGTRNLAYTVYTSGSTGVPKGIDVLHGNVLSLLDAAAELVPPDEDAVWTMFHSTAFDLSVWELWAPLLSGACLVVVPDETAKAPDFFHDLLLAERVTRLTLTPSGLHGLAAVLRERGDDGLALEHVFSCGEQLPAPLARAFLDWCGSLWNLYGPAETTVFVTAQRVRPEDCADAGVPVGRPLANARVHVLDRHGRLVPPEVTGELHISGPAVARGYLHRPELDRERFVASPFHAGERMYRTGDLARLTPDGRVEILGRIDHQVKINGFRVELEEVEAQLDALPGVARAAALLAGGAADDRRLVACVLPEPGAEFTEADLRAALQSRLPSYMVPAAVLLVDEVPLTGNRKVDRAALADRVAQAGAAAGRPAATDVPGGTERAVAGIWQQVLYRRDVGRHDNFFDLGGNSMLLLQVHRRLGEAFPGRPLSVNELFRFTTVADLARRLGPSTAGGGGRAAVGEERQPERHDAVQGTMQGASRGVAHAAADDVTHGDVHDTAHHEEHQDTRGEQDGPDADRGRRRAAKRNLLAPGRTRAQARRGLDRRTSDPSKDGDD
ncbi:non-ribosomal peptide synthetase [Streptomyces sp. NBC_00076]|uniref:non-ribosomal peptide synthetase n=1 Tax=Streptomyces sp. NBC_00076 TaxID=2975642 RepID=UPI0032496834